MKKSTKKLIALLAGCAMLVPNVALADTLNGLSENPADVYIIDDDGRCLHGEAALAGTTIDSTGNVTFTASNGSTPTLTEPKVTAAYREYSKQIQLYSIKANVTGTYTYNPGTTGTAYPEGKYEVFVSLPNIDSTASPGRMGVKVTNGGTSSNEVILAPNKGAEGYTDWNDGEWQSVGVYDFKGQGDTVEVTFYYVDADTTYTNFGKQQIAQFDAVKLVKYNGVEDKVTSVVVDETGKSWVNGSESWSENNGYVDIDGAVAIGNLSGMANMRRQDSLYSQKNQWTSDAYAYGSQHYHTEDSDPISITYYPKLNKGEYKVSVWSPRDPGAYPNRLDISSSDSNVATKEAQILRADGAFIEIGTYNFTGEYGKDFIKLTSDCDGAGYFVTYFDAVKFELVEKNPIAVWSFENGSAAATSDYTWETPVIDETVATNEIGKIGSGFTYTWTHNDTLTTGGVDLGAIPANVDLGTSAAPKDFTFAAWVKQDKSAWYQTIFELKGKRNHDGADYSLTAQLTNNEVRVYNNGNGSSEDENLDAVNVGEWFHLVVTLDTNNANDQNVITTYINGQKIGGRAMGRINGLCKGLTSGDLYIGQKADGTNVFNGDIDEFKMYTDLLTADEVKALYDADVASGVTAADTALTMKNATELDDNTFKVTATQDVVFESAEFEAAQTVDGTLRNGNYYMITGVPVGMYVKSVAVDGKDITVTIDGTAEMKTDCELEFALLNGATESCNANSNAIKIDLASYYDAALLSQSMSADEENNYSYNAYLRKLRTQEATVRAFVAVYNGFALKDVWTDIITLSEDDAQITTDILNYDPTAGDTYRVFIWESESNIEPINYSVN